MTLFFQIIITLFWSLPITNSEMSIYPFEIRSDGIDHSYQNRS